MKLLKDKCSGSDHSHSQAGSFALCLIKRRVVLKRQQLLPLYGGDNEEHIRLTGFQLGSSMPKSPLKIIRRDLSLFIVL